MRPIILVDDEEELVWALTSVLRKEFPQNRILSTTDPHEASRWIASNQPAMLITDVRMPNLSGLELVMRLNQKWGSVPVLVMTAFSMPEVETAAKYGAFKYLPKPFRNSQFVEVVKSMVRQVSDGFQGTVAVNMLADVIQLHALAGGTGVLRVEGAELEGAIWFSEGQIVHAETSTGQEGAEGFYQIMRFRTGQFRFEAGASKKRTIHFGNSELLLEAYHQIDESLRTPAQGGAATTEANASAQEEWLLEPESETEAEATSPPSNEVDDEVFTEGELFLLEEESEPILPTEGLTVANNVRESLAKLESIDGFIGASLADSDSGMVLGFTGGGGILNLEVAAASNSEVVRSKRKAMKALNLRDDIEDILISLGKQYHLIRPMRLKPSVFLYLALDRNRSNLAMARYSLAEVEKELTL